MSSWEDFESVFSDKLFQASAEIHSLACNEDYICVGLRSGHIQVFDLNNDESFQLFSHTLTVNAICLLGHKLFSGGQDSNIIIWDLLSKTEEANLPGHDKVITGLGIIENFLYSISVDQTLKQWDIQEIRKINEISFDFVLCCIKLAENIYLGTEEGNIQVVSYNFEKLLSLSGHLDAVWCIDILGNVMISGSYDGSIILWDTANGNSDVIGEHQGVVNKVAIFDPSHTGIPIIVSVGSDKIIKMWALDGLKDTIEYHTDSISSLEFLDMFFITAGFDKSIRMWSLMNHLKIKTINKGKNNIEDLTCFNKQILWIETNGEILSSAGKKINFNKKALAINYDENVKILAIICDNLICLYSFITEEVIKIINTVNTCNSVAIFSNFVVGCSVKMMYSYSDNLGIRTIDKGGNCIDICSNFIVLAGKNCGLYSNDLILINESPFEYTAVMFSRDQKYLYAAGLTDIILLAVPGLEKLMCINVYICYKRLKLFTGEGIICCNKNLIIRLPEYDIEKQIMFNS